MGYVIGQDNVSSGSAWGSITGTLSSQTDLQSELDDKVDVDGAKVLSANDFTDILKTKLDEIEANADVTDATNVNAAGAVMNSDTDVSAMGFIKSATGTTGTLSHTHGNPPNTLAVAVTGAEIGDLAIFNFTCDSQYIAFSPPYAGTNTVSIDYWCTDETQGEASMSSASYVAGVIKV